MDSKKKIVIADTDNEDLKLLTELLTERGFDISVAVDGLDALQKIGDIRPHVALIAAMLPKLHGFQVCKTIKKSPRTCDTAVLIMSGILNTSLHRYQAINDYFADDFVVKPIERDQLIQKINSFVSPLPDSLEGSSLAVSQSGESKTSPKGKEASIKEQAGLENMLEKTLASLMDFDEIGYDSMTEKDFRESLISSKLEDTLVDLIQTREGIEEKETTLDASPIKQPSISSSSNPMEKEISNQEQNRDPKKKPSRGEKVSDSMGKEKKDEHSEDKEDKVKKSVQQPFNAPSPLKSKRTLLSEVDEDEIDRIIDEAITFDEEDEFEEQPRKQGYMIRSKDPNAELIAQNSGVDKAAPFVSDQKDSTTPTDEDLADFFLSEVDKFHQQDQSLSPRESKPKEEVENTEQEVTPPSRTEDDEPVPVMSESGSDESFFDEELEESDETSEMSSFTSESNEEPFNLSDDDGLLALVSTELAGGEETSEGEEPLETFISKEEPDQRQERELDTIHDEEGGHSFAENDELSEDEEFIAALENLDDIEETDSEGEDTSLAVDSEDSDVVRELDEEEEYGMAFGKYILIEKIATGGMAEIFKAKQRGVEGFEKLVAIKRILPHLSDNKEFVSMFIDEGKIAAQLTHQNIAQIYELGEERGYYYIAMEYVHGKDLKSLMQRAKMRNQPISIDHAVVIISKLCSGLDYAHRKKDFENRDLNIVHRDISPQNVLISYEGEVKIIDFGIAKAAAKDHHTRAGALKGKILYMSPEQAWGKPIDRRSDIFALGTLLYEMLTQRRLFLAPSEIQILQKVREAKVTAPSQLREDISPQLEAIILKALAKNPEDRYQTSGEMQRDLDIFLYSRELKRSTFDLATYMHQLFQDELEGELPDFIDSYREPMHAAHSSSLEQSDYVSVEEDTVATRQEPNMQSEMQDSQQFTEEDFNEILKGLDTESPVVSLLSNPLFIIAVVLIVLIILYFLVFQPMGEQPADIPPVSSLLPIFTDLP